MTFRTIACASTFLVVFASANCGGKAVIDGDNNSQGGAGGTQASSSTNVNVSSSSQTASSSSTGVVECGTLKECCQDACDAGLEAGLECWPPNGSCGCEGLPDFAEECDEAFSELYRCATNAEPFGFGCSANNVPTFLCAPCADEIAAYEMACGGTLPCQ